MANKFPAFVEDEQAIDKTYKVEDEFYKLRRAYGGHDIVVVKDHDDDIMKFKEGVWRDLFDTFIERYRYFAGHDIAEYVMPIYNHGPEAAASIDHPHSQVFTSPIIPNIVAREIAYTKENYARDGKCSFCQMITHEKSENLRTIFENDDFIAFAYFAARFPFETWILPKKHESHFEDITDGEKENLIKICRQVFGQLDVVLGNPPLNFFIHSAPLKAGKMASYHWHMEIAPRLANYGGFEMGSGVIIDIINPESAADYLRLGRDESKK
jgi:UDPglucose--hexose-1-phosphate uridylyltransferase